MAANRSKRITTFSDGTYLVERFEVETPVQMYMHKEDRDAQGYLRSCAPCPAVWVLQDDPHTHLTRQWQYYVAAINYNMTLENIYLLEDDHLAFTNNTGYPTLDNPGDRIDWFFNRNLGGKNVQMDKVRTTSRSVMTGVEDGNSLIVMTFDSRSLPPLKPGRSYPMDISEVNPDDYLYMPETHPYLFLVANIVNRREEVVQFPRGATYPWFEGGTTPVSFMPLISNHAYGPIRYPLSKLVKLPLGSPAPSPYRHNPSLFTRLKAFMSGFIRNHLRAS